MAQAVQTTYSERHGIAAPGLISGTDYQAISRFVETVAGIGFGKAVSQGTAGKQVVIGGSSFLGISLRDVTLIPLTAATADIYRQYENIGVLTEGDIWVALSGGANISEGDAAYYNTTTGVVTGSVVKTTVAAVADGGAGYDVGDTITLEHGVVVTVATLNVTAVATVTITDPGELAADPADDPVDQVSSSGAGTGATFNLTWAAASTAITGAYFVDAGLGSAGDLVRVHLGISK